MLYAPLGYKIMFTFDMPDGTKNGGLCAHPIAIPKLFDYVTAMGGINLVIKDETVYREMDFNSPSLPVQDNHELR